MTVVFGEETENETDCGYDLIRTWRAMDVCGNTTLVSQTVTVEDTTNPVITNAPSNEEVSCDAIPAEATVSATDNCDEDVDVSYSQVVNDGTCPYTIVRTWIATDDCGNQSSASQTLTVVDNDAPVLSGVPANMNTTVGNIPAAAVVTVSDNCSDVDVEFTEVENQLLCGYEIVRTWSSIDDCNNEVSESQTITVSDNVPPTADNPADLTVECGDDIPSTTVTFTDDFDTELTLTDDEVTTDLPCGYEILRTWTATDACGNTTEIDQLISVVDTTNPTLLGVPADEELQCGEEPSTAIVVAQDNCDTQLTVAMNSVTNDLDCGYEIIRTWSTADACGNEASASQTSTYVDSTDPVSSNEPSDMSVECGADVPFSEPSFTDNCEDELDVVFAETSGNFSVCGYDITRTWTASDVCGNQKVVSQTITISDTTAPNLLGMPSDMEVSCDAVPAPVGVSASDNCDDDVNVEFSETSTEGCPHTITRTWTATDACGNTVSESQVLTVVDTTNPVITSQPANSELECGAVILEGEATFSDNCTDEVEVTFSTSTQDSTCGSVITNTWIGEDECGNQTIATQTITIIDTTAPTFDSELDNETFACGNIPAAATVTASDVCSEATVTVDDVTVESPCGLEVTRTYTATDACGNEVAMIQMLSSNDTEDPVATNVPADLSLSCEDAVPAAQPTFTDNCTEQLDVQYSFDFVNESVCGYTQINTWTATDACGNQTEVSQTIIVVDDTNPVFVSTPANITVECNSIPVAVLLEATDNCDNVVEVTVEEQLDAVACPYDITRTWTAIDDCGNTTEYSQIITVQDTTSPTLIGVPSDVQVECTAIPLAPIVSAQDNCDFNLGIGYTESSDFDGCVITITRTWTVEDNCENSAVGVQVITVVDTNPPVLQGVPADVSVDCTNIPDPASVSATDDCNDDIEVELMEEIEDADCGYTLIRTWSAVDPCGNAATSQQVLTILDTQAPQISNVPENMTVECDQLPEFGMIEAVDACGSEVEIETSESQIAASCGFAIVRTWTATDACGNAASVSQEITVTDTTLPVLGGIPANVTVTCTEIPEIPEFSATDNCDDDVSTDVTDQMAMEGCNLIITRVFRGVDNCGNTAIATQTITVVDNEDPVISGGPADLSVDCSNIPLAASLTAIDNCDDDVEVTFVEEATGTCDYDLVRTWTATDECGNTDVHVQTIHVVDTTAPSFGSFDTEVYVSCEEFSDYEIEVSDDCNTLELTYDDIFFSGGCFGVLQRTWTATDACGNSATALQFIRQVDEINPVLFNVPDDITVECGEDIPQIETFVSATDNCDDDVEISFIEEVTSQFCPYVITRTWLAEDECGNVAEGTQVITIEVDAPEQVSIFSYPNPFNDSFTVNFSVPQNALVNAKVVDGMGRTVSIVFDGQADGARLYEYTLSGLDWEPGSYTLMMVVGGEVHHHKLMVQNN